MRARGFVLDELALSKGKVFFHGCTQVDPSRPLIVKYPNEYPSLPPNVYSDTPGNYLPRHHHRGSGEICTFGPRRARWDASKCGVDAVDEAEDVISKSFVGSPPVAGDDAPEPITAELDYSQDCFVLIPSDIVIGLRDVKEGSRGPVRIFSRAEKVLKGAEALRGVVVDVSINEKQITAPEYYKKWPLGSAMNAHGTLVVLPAPPVVPKDPRTFFGWLEKYGSTKAESWTIFAYPDQTIEKSRTQLQFFGVHLPKKNEYKLVKVYQMIAEDRSARVPNLEGLTEKKVLLLGCGSLGSKIGVGLAATGVKRFCLLDADNMEPGNAVRHEVGAEAFGLPKAYALLKRMNDINPETHSVSAWVRRTLGDPDAPTAFDVELQGLIRQADMVIEATGVHAVGRYVNELCFEFGVPAVFVSLTNGAWAGEVVRTIPGRTACWMCWVNQYYDDRPPLEPQPSHGVFAPGCNQPTFTGTTYEVGIVANFASWLAVDTLLRDEQGRKEIRGDYVRWKGRDSAGTPIFETHVLPVNARAGCKWCG